MNKLKNKYPNADIFLISALLLFVFWVFCTKMIIKMDDGHFMGILANENFSLSEWLRLRYETVSGRTAAEAMMISFLKAPHILWKLFGFALFEYVIYFIYKISPVFGNQSNKRNLATMSCCSVFMIFIGVLNAGAFWFAGSFTFLVPFTFMLIAISPAVFDFLDIKYHLIHKIIAVPCAVVAVSQEQASICTCMFLLCFFALVLFRKEIRIGSFVPLVPAVAGTIYLLTSPGVSNRGSQHASDSFKAFNDFGAAQKLLLGFSNYCSYTFFFSELFMVIACIVLFSNLKISKFSNVILRISTAVAGVFYVLNVINFCFLEIPIMN